MNKGMGQLGGTRQTVALGWAKSRSGSGLWAVLAALVIAFALYGCAADVPVVASTTPANVQVTRFEGQVSIRWDAVVDATSYTLYWSLNSGTGTAGTAITNAYPGYSHTSLTNWDEYFYVVTATVAGIEGAASAEASGIPVPRMSSLGFANLQITNCVNALGAVWADEITSLSCSLGTTTDLTGLENLRALTILGLPQMGITDVTPLAPLTKLTTLALHYNNITDATPLAGLTGLITLDLQGSALTSAVPLGAMTNLVELNLSGSTISDASPLASHTNLVSLVLSGNNISDLTPLTSLTKLQYLYLDGNNISDLTPLASLTGLYHLRLSNNLISNVSPLSSLTLLGDLRLDGNTISDVTPLAPLTNLTFLALQSNLIVDVSPLTGLTSMSVLSLMSNAITTGVPSLSTLVLANTVGLDGNVGIPCTDLATLRTALGSAVSPATAVSGTDCT